MDPLTRELNNIYDISEGILLGSYSEYLDELAVDLHQTDKTKNSVSIHNIKLFLYRNNLFLTRLGLELHCLYTSHYFGMAIEKFIENIYALNPDDQHILSKVNKTTIEDLLYFYTNRFKEYGLYQYGVYLGMTKRGVLLWKNVFV